MALTKLPGFTLLNTDSFTFGNANVSGNVIAGNIKTDNLLYANGTSWDLNGTYSNSNVSAYLSTATISTTSNVTANYHIGNGSTLTHITGANIDGYVPLSTAANTASTVTTNAQPNITSVGTLTSLTVTGLTTTGNVKTTNIQDASGTITLQTNYNAKAGDVGVTGNIVAGTGGSGNVTATYFIGNGSQLTGLPSSYSNTNVTAYLTTATINTTGNITGNYIIGNGSQLTGLPAGYANSNVASYLPTYTGNILAGNANITGTLTTGTITTTGTNGNISGVNYVISNYFVGNGSTLTHITGANIDGYAPLSTAANTAGTVTTNAQPNITSVGTLTSLTVSTDVVIGGNLTVSGTQTTVNSTTVNVNDINLVLANNATTAAQANGGGITINGASASMVYDNPSNSFVFSHPITANGSLLTNITGSAVSGNVSQAVHSYYSDVANSVTGSNVSGQVSNALIAGTVYTNAQPNITSVGTLTSLSVTGLTTTGNVKTTNIQGSDGTVVLQTNYNAKAGDLGVVGNLTVGTGGSGIITATGANLGAVGNVHITGGTNGQVLTTNGSGTLSWSTVTGGSGSGSSITYTAATTPPGTANVADQWYNTTTNTLYEYMNDGSANYWIDVQTPTVATPGYQTVQLSFNTRTYTGTGAQVNFTVSSNLIASSVIVTIDGVVQTPTTDYSITNTILTFTSAPYNGASIQIRELGNQVPYALTNLTLGSNANVIITGGSSGQVLTTDGSGHLSWGQGGQSNTSIRAQAMTMGIIFGG